VGIANAFTTAGNNASVRINSLSMGRLTSSSQISDAVKYAYGKGKLIFCAAGTSFWWSSWFVGVIFPASMAEAVAVTGIQDNLTSACNTCHTGSKVDFVVVNGKKQQRAAPHHAGRLRRCSGYSGWFLGLYCDYRRDCRFSLVKISRLDPRPGP